MVEGWGCGGGLEEAGSGTLQPFCNATRTGCSKCPRQYRDRPKEGGDGTRGVPPPSPPPCFTSTVAVVRNVAGRTEVRIGSRKRAL